MPEMIEYRFNFPKLYPAPSNISRNMRLSLLRGKSFGAVLRGYYSYETVEAPGQSFRSTTHLHVDKAQIGSRTGFQGLEMCATSSPTIFAEGTIGIDPNVHPLFRNRRYSTASAITKIGFELGDENWLDDLIDKSSPPEHLVGVHILDDFRFIQTEPFEMAEGLVQETLHKSALCIPEDPTNRTFYRKYLDFKF
jgi:hypothetical protein